MIIPVHNSPKVFIDLRKEMHELFYGSPTAPGQSFEVIVKHVDKTQRCPCWDHIKKEADPSCYRCTGKGWLFFDKVYRAIKRKYIGKEVVDPAGQFELDSTLFFFEHMVPITEDDTVVEVVTDDNGKIVSPVKYIKKHSVKDVEPLRANNGRVEFIKIFARKAE